jgi:hypothetical protein
MKRYLLFCGESYYPVGGWDDFVGDFDTVEEAKSATAKASDWAHIVDTDTGERVGGEWDAGWFTEAEIKQRKADREAVYAAMAAQRPSAELSVPDPKPLSAEQLATERNALVEKYRAQLERKSQSDVLHTRQTRDDSDRKS